MIRVCLVGAAILLALGKTASAADQAQAVPTFHCVGLYWSPKEGSTENVCRVWYRGAGAESWREAMPLWFDGREPQEALPAEHSRQYRGSLVNLTPGTEYDVELSLEKTGQRASLRVRTWSERFPVGETVEVCDGNVPLAVKTSGTADGYVLYTCPPDSAATIDMHNEHAQCVEVRASYVILRGLTLKNAQQHGIRLFEGCHDVVIEGCDISGWGRIAEDGWGVDYDSAVYSNSRDVARVIVQGNHMHHPRSNSNNWRQTRTYRNGYQSSHPQGPQVICLWDSEGNHVFRYNTVDSDDDHQYNDAFGAGHNFSVRGFPNCDSDIYGNLLSHCWDDTIESEGANCNVRIWGNYTTESLVSIACASTSIGPLYVWRNVSGVTRVAPGEWSGGFLKTSDKMAGGRIFVFHNTILQPMQTVGDKTAAAGASMGLGWGGPMVNVTSRNNILHARSTAIQDKARDPLADYDYDLYTGALRTAEGHESHGIKGEPIYVDGAELKDGQGRFDLAPQSPGYDAGLRLPNFNDGFTGRGPDMGAQEAGTPPMRFGVEAFDAR